LKQSHSTRTKRKAIANIQQSCSDSPAIANPMDGVFGTDRALHKPLFLLVPTPGLEPGRDYSQGILGPSRCPKYYF
jgi:hypothetical protein